MEIKFQQVCPLFLEKDKIASSEVWEKDLFFKQGEKIQLVAPSGRGKTSLIHFLYGLRKDYSGSIFFDNKNVAGFHPEELAQYRSSRLGIVFQDLRLFADHSVFQNITIKKILDPYPGAAGIEVMAGRLGILNKLDQKAGICSYGERQRIAIIRALQQPFDFLILDEPFSHLDEGNARKAMELINEEVDKRQAGIMLTDLAPVKFFDAGRTFML